MLLQEFFLIENLQVINESKASGKMKLRGTFQRADEENNNKRVYGKAILERETKKLNNLIKENRLVGALDHPEYTDVRLQDASHKITKLYMEGNEVKGELELLSTPAGQIAQCLVRDGVNLGISSRGTGTLTQMDEARSMVNEDYDMRTYDLVADPSTRGAFPGMNESKQEDLKGKIEGAYKKVLGEAVFMELLKETLNEAFQPGASKKVAKLEKNRKKVLWSKRTLQQDNESKAKLKAAKDDHSKRLGKRLKDKYSVGDKYKKDSETTNEGSGGAKALLRKQIAKRKANKDTSILKKRRAYKDVEGDTRGEGFNTKGSQDLKKKIEKKRMKNESSEYREIKTMDNEKASDGVRKGALRKRIQRLKRRGEIKGNSRGEMVDRSAQKDKSKE